MKDHANEQLKQINDQTNQKKVLDEWTSNRIVVRFELVYSSISGKSDITEGQF